MSARLFGSCHTRSYGSDASLRAVHDYIPHLLASESIRQVRVHVSRTMERGSGQGAMASAEACVCVKG